MGHSNLTVVAVYGHTDGGSAIPSLVRAVEQLPGSKGLLLSPSKPKHLPDYIEHKVIGKLDYFQYSFFCMYALHTYINTSHVLIVQDDGFVIDGKNFNPLWYSYDYIGAPTHCAMTADKYYYNWTWQQVNEPMYIIQNGGLSLRSARFLRAPSDHGIIHKTHNVIPFCNEDVQLTGFMRAELESVGMLYAQDHVAKYFSVEYCGPTYHDDMNFDKLFGCHGPTRKLVSTDTLYINITKDHPDNLYKETDFLSFLRTKGFKTEFFKVETTEQNRTKEADTQVL